MKNFISVIISLILTISLFMTTVFICIQQEVAIFDIVLAESDLSSLDLSSVSISDLESLEDFDLSDVKDLLKETLKSGGYDPEFADYIVESEELNAYLDKYKESYIAYLKDENNPEPEIDDKEFQAIVDKIVEKYNSEHDEPIVIDSFEVTDAFTSGVNNVSNIINSNDTIMKSFRFIFNMQYQRIALLITFACFIALFILNRSRIFLFLEKPFLLNALACFSLRALFKIHIISELEVIFGNIYVLLVKYLNIFGIAYLALGILCFILCYLMREAVKKSNDPLLKKKNKKDLDDEDLETA